MSAKGHELLNRWLQGEDISTELADVPESEDRPDWKTQSNVDTLLRMQEGKLGLSEDFTAKLLARADAGEQMAPRRQPSPLRFLPHLLGVAAMACLMFLGMGYWYVTNLKSTGPVEPLPPRVPPSALTGWVVHTKGGEFEITGANTVELKYGDLGVRSLPTAPGTAAREPLRVETALATLISKEGDFRVNMDSTTITVEISLGRVSLTTPHGTVSGDSSHVLRAEPDFPPYRTPVIVSPEPRKPESQ